MASAEFVHQSTRRNRFFEVRIDSKKFKKYKFRSVLPAMPRGLFVGESDRQTCGRVANITLETLKMQLCLHGPCRAHRRAPRLLNRQAKSPRTWLHSGLGRIEKALTNHYGFVVSNGLRHRIDVDSQADRRRTFVCAAQMPPRCRPHAAQARSSEPTSVQEFNPWHPTPG